jgi:hypothetical protein
MVRGNFWIAAALEAPRDDGTPERSAFLMAGIISKRADRKAGSPCGMACFQERSATWEFRA